MRRDISERVGKVSRSGGAALHVKGGKLAAHWPIDISPLSPFHPSSDETKSRGATLLGVTEA
jgi:hypothetical protein